MKLAQELELALGLGRQRRLRWRLRQAPLRTEPSAFGCTQPQSVIARQLRSNPRVGLEVAVNEPPYRGVSGQGDARIVEGDAMGLLSELAERYLPGQDGDLKKWLLSRADTEVILEVKPQHLTSWDFRSRMSSPRS